MPRYLLLGAYRQSDDMLTNEHREEGDSCRELAITLASPTIDVQHPKCISISDQLEVGGHLERLQATMEPLLLD